uniref:Uncharacterized protein n=1 Tax=Glossina pallidipes TaxID=7398 RepID=A0A1B0A6V6_GLOPL
MNKDILNINWDILEDVFRFWFYMLKHFGIYFGTSVRKLYAIHGDGVAVPDTDVICLTIPLPNCCHNPVPDPNGPVDNTVDGRRERIDCILDESKNGTLLEVFGIDPPCCVEDNK